MGSNWQAKASAINLSQGFSYFEPDPILDFDLVTQPWKRANNQYAPMAGVYETSWSAL